MPHAFDANELLRDGSTAGSLNASETGAGHLVYQTPVVGLAARVVVPAAAGSSPTCTLAIQESADNITYATIAQKVISATGEHMIRFATNQPYVRHLATVAGTGADFGAVDIGLVIR